MFEGTLSGKDHGNLWIRLIARLDHFKIPHGTARLNNGADPFFDGHIHAVPEREKCIGNH
jgi:hypothetical protein